MAWNNNPGYCVFHSRKMNESMNFDLEVIEKSNDIPVLVDFWAPWCGPCQSLGPIITQAAEESNGRWELVKVNTDEYPDLMQQFGIRSIPAVKLFSKGKVIAEFSGLLPKHELEKWLDKNIPDPRLSQLELIKDNESELRTFIQANNDLIDAKVALIRLTLFSNPAESHDLASVLPAGIRYFDELETYKNLASFLTHEVNDESPVALKIKAAQEASIALDHEKAVELLIESIMIDKSYESEMARLTTISYFHFLGKDHDITKALRRRFDMALY